jgi:anti-sigma B factor antagonist
MPGPDFSATVEETGQWVVVSVAGEVDLSTSPSLRRALEKAARKGPDVVVDLSDVTFLDSTGLGDLVRAREMVVTAGGQFSLVVNQPRIQRVLDITGLNEVFYIHETLAAATT